MKKIAYTLLLLCSIQYAFAQDADESIPQKAKLEDEGAPHFNKEKIFTGGGVSLGYGTNQNGDNTTNNTFNIGVIPDIGYSLSNLVDVGISTSINYTSTTNSAFDTKFHYTTYSLGAFIRVYPIKSFFIQLMPEQDWGRAKQVTSGYTYITKIKSNSFLAGVGFGERLIGESYFYTLIMVDLGKDRYSPYNSYNSSTGQVSLVPIVRGGFNFYPFRKKQK